MDLCERKKAYLYFLILNLFYVWSYKHQFLTDLDVKAAYWLGGPTTYRHFDVNCGYIIMFS